MLESVPNFSEGRDRDVVDALGAALSAPARLLDVHVDADHRRSVFTLVGEADELVRRSSPGSPARDRIDLRRHEGAHPRTGAADVVPVVPIAHEQMEHAKETARELARRIGGELGLPVFLYGELAPGRGRRSSGAAGRRSCNGGSTPASSRPTSGRAGWTSGRGRDRGREVAADRVQRQPARRAVDSAKAVAAVVRESGGGFPGVRALGLDLPRAGRRPGLDERRGLGGGRAARDRRADRRGGGGARRGGE